MNNIIVGVAATISVLYVTFINVSHIYLKRESTESKSKLAKYAAIISHAALIITGLSSFFLMLSYFRPETMFSNQACLCRVWFIAAVSCYVSGIYLMKFTYFMHIILLHSHFKQSKQSLAIKVAFFNIAILGSAIFVLQSFVLNADCPNDSQFGCQISFPSWNGFMGCACAIINGIIYFWLINSFVKLTVLKGDLDAVNNTGAGQDKHEKHQRNSTTIESVILQEIAKESIFKDVIYQFIATILALCLCFLDLLVNSIAQNYTFLTLLAFDSALVVTSNFLGFRESRHFLKQIFEKLDASLMKILTGSSTQIPAHVNAIDTNIDINDETEIDSCGDSTCGDSTSGCNDTESLQQTRSVADIQMT